MDLLLIGQGVHGGGSAVGIIGDNVPAAGDVRLFVVALLAEEAQAIAALIEAVPVAELQDRAKALFNKAGDGGKAGKEALAQAKLYTKAIDKATSAEAELLKVQVKEVKDSIRTLLKEVDDLYTLQEVRDLLQGSVYDTEALL